MAQFKRTDNQLAAADVVAYTAPQSGAIIIGLLAAHNGSSSSPYGINVRMKRGSNERYLLGKGTPVHPKGAMSIDQGKIVLEPGDQIIASADAIGEGADGSVDLSVSIMEF